MSWNDVTDPKPHRSHEELLALVYAKAHTRARAKRVEAVLAIAVAVVLIAGVAGVMRQDNGAPKTEVRSGPGKPRVISPLGEVPTTTGINLAPPLLVPPPLPTSLPSTLIPPTSAPAEQPAPDGTEPPPPASPDPTTNPACHDSRDPSCGALAWDPAPGPNQPLTASISITPQSPKVGDEVTFHVIVDDPDAPIELQCIPVQTFGDGSPSPMCALGACPPKYGPWTPAVLPGHQEISFTHVYSSAGTYVATFGLSSGSCDASQPYSSYGEGTATVVVT